MSLFGKVKVPAFVRHYKYDLPITALIAVLVGLLCGPAYLWPFAILVVLEVSLSFDNAVVNAKVLERLSHGWRMAFLFVGIWIAVLGMRFVFPILIVSLIAGLGFGEVIQLALNNPEVYAHHLEAAHPEIATLGGVYLGMIFLNFFLADHENYWLGPIERVLTKVGKSDNIGGAIMLVILLVISSNIGGEEGRKILFTGAVSMALYFTVQFFAALFEKEDEEAEASSAGKVIQAGIAGLGLFIYLEVQDMAFSFDGVSGAFAITNNVIVIMAGLGIGALFVRSMTIHLVEDGHLESLPFLENGAHWAIGVLAACILASIYVPIPEWATGGIGVVFIVASVISSIRFKKAEKAAELADGSATAVAAQA